MYLPQDVIGLIASKTDVRTRARMRAMNKASSKNPVMAKTLRTGYAYGTGKHQRLYNELWKRLVQMERSYPSHPPRPEMHRLYALQREVGDAIRKYTASPVGKARELALDKVLPKADREARSIGWGPIGHADVSRRTQQDRLEYKGDTGEMYLRQHEFVDDPREGRIARRAARRAAR